MATKRKVGDELATPRKRRAVEPYTPQTSQWDLLPDEILLPILVDLMHPADTFLASQVCRRWRYIIPNRLENFTHHASGFKAKWITDHNLHLLTYTAGKPEGDLHSIIKANMLPIAAKANILPTLLAALDGAAWGIGIDHAMSTLTELLKGEADTATCLKAIRMILEHVDTPPTRLDPLMISAASRGKDAKEIVLAILEIGGLDASALVPSMIDCSVQNRDQTQPIQDSLFVWLRLVGLEWTSDTISRATEAGDIDALEWMRAHMFVTRTQTLRLIVSAALRTGRRNVLEWMCNLGWLDLTRYSFVSCDIHPSLLEWLALEKGVRTEQIVGAAIFFWNIPLLRDLLEDPAKRNGRFIRDIFVHGFTKPDLRQVFEWMIDLGFSLADDTDVIPSLIASGRTDMLGCVFEAGARCYKSCFSGASRLCSASQAVDVCEFLVKVAGLRPTSTHIQKMARRGHLDAVKLMVDYVEGEVDWANISLSLARIDQVEIIRWAHDCDFAIANARDLMRISLKHGAYETVKWLLHVGEKLPPKAVLYVGSASVKHAPVPLLKLVFDQCLGQHLDWSLAWWVDRTGVEMKEPSANLFTWALRRGYPVCLHVLQEGRCPHPDRKCAWLVNRRDVQYQS